VENEKTFMDVVQAATAAACRRNKEGLLPLTYVEGIEPAPSDILYSFGHSFGGGLSQWNLREEYHNLVWDDPKKAPEDIRLRHFKNEVVSLIEKYDINNTKG
tara:strand:+ start:217 stop:522 length:306 start_codon:yes stop_codon:yes gene_type:complete